MFTSILFPNTVHHFSTLGWHLGQLGEHISWDTDAVTHAPLGKLGGVRSVDNIGLEYCGIYAPPLDNLLQD